MDDEQEKLPADPTTPVGEEAEPEPAALEDESDADVGPSLLWLAVALVLLVGVGAGGYWLFANSGDDGPSSAAPGCRDFDRPEGALYEDGLVSGGEGNTIELIDMRGGGAPQTYRYTEKKSECLNISHAEGHTALGQLTRIYYEKRDGDRWVLFMEDAPVN